MARRPRHDGPDTWHHVMNRGLAKRTIFESEEDRRFFLSLLAREVREGRLEIHAFCLMLTHFHLLVRSLKGELSEALRRIQNRYARWFNRTRRRDGPLFRGRFKSRPIDSLRYRRKVVRYVHDNPVVIGLVADAAQYRWSSAWYVARARPRIWMETSWIESEMAARGAGETARERLFSAFPTDMDEDERLWVERQLCARLPDEDEEDVSLKYAGSPRVVRWTIRKARLADGTRPWRPVSPVRVVERVLETARRRIGPLLGLFKRKSKDAWIALRAGLLRLLSGPTHREIALRIGRHPSTISRDIASHGQLTRTTPAYEQLAARLAHEVLEAAR